MLKISNPEKGPLLKDVSLIHYQTRLGMTKQKLWLIVTLIVSPLTQVDNCNMYNTQWTTTFKLLFSFNTRDIIQYKYSTLYNVEQF